MSNQTIRLPKAIQAEVDRVAQLEAPPTPPPALDVPPVDQAPPATPPVEPPAATPDQSVDQLKADLARANQRASTAEGMLRSQGEQMRQERADSTGRFQKMDQQIAHLTELIQAKQTTAEPSVKDVEAFGADLVDMVRRQSDGIAREAVQQHLSAVLDRISKLEQNVNGVSQNVTASAERSFFGELERAVSDWREINADARFHAWLAEIDPIYGVRRQDALITAQQAQDAQRVVSIFNAFKATLPPPKPAPKQELQAQVAPARSGNEQATPQPGVEYVRQSEIDNFQRLASRGQFRGTEAEMDALTTKYHRAILEGRVIP